MSDFVLYIAFSEELNPSELYNELQSLKAENEKLNGKIKDQDSKLSLK